jgi:hypothetical protein
MRADALGWHLKLSEGCIRALRVVPSLDDDLLRPRLDALAAFLGQLQLAEAHRRTGAQK